ncbi:hypothetical protein [Streptomyces aureoverticillatus]|uniref:hypothetical protein n=1 Tax=Streptomyces aureoverticillatus TaxID=66871 RepID=UPI0013DA5B58|nr:hypothetical protein [Streptomyces aureoverticillatus]QIB44949.1 hypothetical protein G3H79_19620 [Streptomyces aureoverticillatus]
MSDDDDLFGGTGETRTRLPEGDGADGYGSARRSGRSAGRSPSRSVVTVIGVVVLLIAAIAFANRDDSSSDGGDDGGGGGGSKAAPTAPTGEKPVSGKAGGIPSGYAKSQQGVESATANYAVALGSADMFNKARRHAIVDTVYTPTVASERKPALDKVYAGESFLARIGLNKDGSAPNGTTFVSRIIPVGTKVTKFGGGSATVEIWYSSLFGLAGENTENPVSESWFTNTYEMRWVGGDWKVADFKQKDGPVPVGRDQRASTADDMAKAVEEFGGFTYAR